MKLIAKQNEFVEKSSDVMALETQVRALKAQLAEKEA